MNRRWLILALVFLGIVISYVDRGNLSIAAPAIMHDFGIAPSVMGFLLSAFFWTYGAFQIPSGIVVDRFGIRWPYAVGFLIWSLASASMALARNSGDIVGLRLVLGFAESIGALASLSFIRNNFEDRSQGLPTAIYIAGQNIGPALGALAGSILLARFGWRTMFAVTGIGALLWLPCWLMAVPSVRNVSRVSLPGYESMPERAPEKEPAARLSPRLLALLGLCILLASYYWYFVLTWVPSYLTLSKGFSTLEMGRIVSTGLFTMAATNIAAGLAADRLSARFGVLRSRLFFAATGYLGTAAILLLLVVPDRAWVVPIFTFSMCATGAGNSSFWAIAQFVPSAGAVGKTVGFFNTLSQVAGIAAPIVTGWLLGPQRQFGSAILVAGICPVFAAFCLMAMWPKPMVLHGPAR
jgi:MFS family permease